MNDLASELRYDPDDDDTQPPRSPSAVLRVLTAAAGPAMRARTPLDVYEQVCRSLAEQGVTAAILGARHPDGPYTLLAHRLGTEPAQPLLSLAGLAQVFQGGVSFAPGEHPLCQALAPEGALSFPSVAAPIRTDDERPSVILSLFAPDLGPEHGAVAEAFGVLLGAVLMRIAVDAQLRESRARTEQRIRARTLELSALNELSLALFTASSEAAAARLAVDAARRIMARDVAGVLLCVDQQHRIILAAQNPLTPELTAALTARLRTGFETLLPTSREHDGHTEHLDVVEAAAPGGVALGGDPASVVEAPVMSGGRPIGLLSLASQRPGALTPQQVGLLYSLAGQLALAVERFVGARAADRERLDSLLESLSHGVVILDGAGKLLAGNPAGRHSLTALGADGEGVPAPVAPLVDAALAEGVASATLTTRDEPPQHLTVTATRLPDLAGSPAVALTLHDTTEAGLMRERLFQSEKMASVGRLVSGVAHELNNPLTGIMGFAQLLLMRDLDPAARREAETIFAEAERASKIVQNLLSFARRRPPEKTAVDLNALVVRALELWEYGIGVKGADIEVRRRLADHLPLCLADPHQVQQVLLNILTNAGQAIVEGEGRGVITIRTAAVPGYVRAVISDTGPGIPQEDLRSVFDPFFTTKPVGEGTGLGLAICYGIVEEHNGRIAVDSPAGAGATFTIDLQVAPADNGQRATGQPEHEEHPAHDSRRILVVDDEQTIQDLLAGVLSLDGHQVETVSSAPEALERLERERFDAVICDVRMPGMDGITFYQHVAERDPALARRIIFISGDTVSRETRAFVESAGAPFLAKPFTVRKVRELVAESVAGSEAEPPGRQGRQEG